MLHIKLDNGVEPNTLDEICENNIVAQRYLLHLDNPEKAQYDLSEVTSYNVNLDNIFDVGTFGTAWEVDALSMLVSGVDKFEIAKNMVVILYITIYNLKRLQMILIMIVIIEFMGALKNSR